MSKKKRQDRRGRVLKKGEYQKEDGYEYRWTAKNGKRYSRHAPTLDELRQIEEQIQKDIADGINSDSVDKTVAELAEEYFDIKKLKWKRNTVRAYTTALNTIKASSFGKKKLKTVTKKMAQKWFLQLNKDGYKRSTIELIKNILHPAFEDEVDEDHIRKNPFRFNLCDLLPDDSTKRQALTEEQTAHYMQFLRQYGTGSYLDDIIILKETGVRIGELYGITIKDVDLINNVLHIERQLGRTADKQWFIETPKSKYSKRDIPLTDEACEAFRHAIANRQTPQIEIMIDGIGGFVFLDKNGMPKTGMHCENYMRVLHKKYVELYGEGVPSITPHVFRHTFATRMMQRGLDPKSICYIMGDNSIEIIMNTYTHADFPFINQAFKQAMNIDTPNSSTISSTNS